MKDNGLWIVATLIIVVALVLYVWFRLAKHRNKTTSKKVVSLTLYRKAAASNGVQKCGMCKKKAGKLTFYADHNGTVVGVCKECKPLVERKGMLPI